MDVTNVIGDYGEFQKNVYLFCLLRGVPNGLHLVIYSFFLPAVEYWCAMPDSLEANVTSEQWKSLVLPNSTLDTYKSSLGNGRCRMFDIEFVGNGTPVFRNETVRCNRWEYGESYYRSSLVQEWDLVCERAWTRSLVQTATMSGMLVGTLLSSLGDRLGRRPMVIAGFVASFVGSVCVAVSPWFSLLLFSRGLLGLGLGLGQTASFCLLMEVIGPERRTTAAVAFSVGFAMGIIMLPGIAWLLQDWRTLQGAISVPLLVFVVWSWYLPESPRWLIATGKMDAARKVILKACADNRQPVDDIDSVLGQLRKKILQQEQEAQKKAGCLDLVRSRRIFIYTCALVYASAASGFLFYGLQLSVTNLGGDPYLTFVIAAVAEFPVAAFCYVAVRWCRRRSTVLVVYCVTGACAFAVAVLPPTWVAPRQVCVIGGKMLASATLTIVWIYAAEVFPTLYRTVGISACLIGTRVGSSMAPFLLELRTYLTDAVPMGTLAGVAALGSALMLLLPETLRVSLPDTIRESKQLGDSKKVEKDASCKVPATDTKLPATEPSAGHNDIRH